MRRPWPALGCSATERRNKNAFIKILCMFRALPCPSSGGLRRNCIYAASGIVTLCRWLSCISNLMHKILIYLYIIHLLKSSTCFEHYPALLQEVYVVIVYMQPLVSSLSAGYCPVHRLTGAQDSHPQRVTIPEAAYIQLRRRPPEDGQGNARSM